MNHIDKNHPVRFLIESAASGRKLTAGDLKILANADLPEGESLTSFSSAVDRAARRVAAIGMTGESKAARDTAEQEWSQIAASMTEDQLAVKTTEAPCARQVFETVRCVFLLCRSQVAAVLVSGECGGR
ncbi:hypothetical protein IWX78_001337, partial [Mycetocola sp. CAN_C7]|uniref:hypothetical protein n=1 Tax=Mycetocola sp. CAN_C7 TaxID=2787724 RepID=UPI0018CA50AC